MNIECFASSSAGNLYLISDGESNLLLEAGLPIKQIRKNVDLTSVSGCLISHEHSDHSKSVSDLCKAGIDVFMSAGTQKSLAGEEGMYQHQYFSKHQHRVRVLSERLPFYIKSYEVMPFSTQHDCAEPYGYFIRSKATGEKLLFATDTYYVKYKFPVLDYIMIECNYSYDILIENVAAGRVNNKRKERLLQSHFSLENVKGFLGANDLSQVKQIWLLHLSDDNSDEERFKREIQQLTGKVVIVAKRG